MNTAMRVLLVYAYSFFLSYQPSPRTAQQLPSLDSLRKNADNYHVQKPKREKPGVAADPSNTMVFENNVNLSEARTNAFVSVPISKHGISRSGLKGV